MNNVCRGTRASIVGRAKIDSTRRPSASSGRPSPRLAHSSTLIVSTAPRPGPGTQYPVTPCSVGQLAVWKLVSATAVVDGYTVCSASVNRCQRKLAAGIDSSRSRPRPSAITTTR